jgi:hypothetical protein
LTDEGTNVDEEEEEEDEDEDDDDDEGTLESFNDVSISFEKIEYRNGLRGQPCKIPREEGIWVGTEVS